RRGLGAIDELLRRGTPCQRLAGAWNGLGGLIYTYSHLAVLWRDEALLARAAAWLPDLRPLIEKDESLDLMNGAAGAIAALLVLRTPARLHQRLDPFLAAWCNGAAGIGLARLGTLPLLDDPAVRAEIAIAVETTLASGFGKNHCLCHGDLGNVELLLLAGQR